MNILILGDGATGTAAVEEIRRVDSQSTVVMIADEPNPSYFRAALTNYLLGELTDRQLQAVAPDFYHRHRVRRLFGRALDVQPQQRRVLWQTPNGQKKMQSYDKLIISTGSRPRVHSSYAPYMRLPWVRTLRTLVDAKQMEERLEQGQIRSAVVVGGGPLALEWIAVMRRRGVHVHLFLRTKKSMMRNVLDDVARDLLLARMKQEGVEIHIDEIQHIESDQQGNVTAVHGKKTIVEADFVGLAMGVEPNSECAANAGLRMHHKWIMTNEAGQTTDPYIYAGGDVASVRESGSLGLWGPARKMGICIGRHMTKQSVVTDGSTHYFATRLYDLDCVFAGQLHVEGAHVLSQTTPSEGKWGYRRLVIHQGLLVGFLCLGEVSENIRKQARLWHELIDADIQVREVQDKLLVPQFDLDSWMNTRLNRRHHQPFQDPWEPASPPQQPSIQLQPHEPMLSAVDSQKQWKVRPETLLGRSAASLVNVQETVNGDSISSQHASIRWDGRRYVLQDLQSANGTFVNDRRVEGVVPLRVNDVIRLGEVSFVFDPTDHTQTNMAQHGVERVAGVVDAPVEIEVLWEHGSLRLNKEWHRIGRAAQSDIRLSNDSVSSHHAELVWQNGTLFLRDLGSTNGTFWNDRRVTTPVPIQNTGSIKVGTEPISVRVLQAQKRPPKEQQSFGWMLLCQGNKYPIARNTCLDIGRAKENHIVVMNDSVSSKHAQIVWDRERPAITDVGSSNGTKINGRLLKSHQPHYLNDGDELMLGEQRMEVRAQVIQDKAPQQPLKVSQKSNRPSTQPQQYKREHVASVVLHATHAKQATVTLSAGRSVIVGRDGNRSNWVLDESSVSGRHGAFRVHEGRLEYRDLGSSNGSFIGSVRLGEHWTPVGQQRIRLGEHCIVSVQGETS